MKKYKCKSKSIMGIPCGHACEVKADFHPKACVKDVKTNKTAFIPFLWERWEEVEDEVIMNKCLHCGKELPYCHYGYCSSDCVDQVLKKEAEQTSKAVPNFAITGKTGLY